MTYDNIRIHGTLPTYFCIVAMTFCALAFALAVRGRPPCADGRHAPVSANCERAGACAVAGETAQRMRQDMQSVLSHLAETRRARAASGARRR